MNAPRAGAEDYVQFLLATPSACSAVEAARVQPARPGAPAHDAFTRLLTRLEPDPAELWAEVAPLLRPGGVLIVDDTTLDKPYARKVDLVSSHWSGKHGAVVRGVSLVTAVWSDGGTVLPTDYRVYTPTRAPRRTTTSGRCSRRRASGAWNPGACCSTRGTPRWTTSNWCADWAWPS